MKLIECVPNISEGKNTDNINKIVSVLKNDPNIHLLDVDSGYDTNRTVITFIGEPDYVISAAYNLYVKALECINMRDHKGEHPRMGSVDVCPLIPVLNVTMQDCIKYSNVLAENISKELNIPIYMYEKSAKHESRENLASIRSGEYEGFYNKIILKDWIPDYGAAKMNEVFGVSAIGAREFLIAYNINLNTHDKKIATDIALDIREIGRLKRDKNNNILKDENGKNLRKKGKFKDCKAVGWYIDEYKQTQVSINLTNYKKTSIHKVFQEVRRLARIKGTRVTGSEIIGLSPKRALLDAGKHFLKKQNKSFGIPELDIIDIAIKSLGLNDLSRFEIKDKIIEFRLYKEKAYLNYKIKDFVDSVSRGTPTPGGGSVSSLAAALGASLSSMVSNLTINKKGFEEYNNYLDLKSSKCQDYMLDLLQLIDDDSNSYENIIKAVRLPKKNPKESVARNIMIEKATINATNIPLKILKVSTKVISCTYDICNHGNPNSISDIGVAAELLKTAGNGAYYNILINIKGIKDKKKIRHFKNKYDYYLKDLNNYYTKIINLVNKELSNG